MNRLRANWFEVIFWTIILGCTVGAMVGCEQQPAPPQPRSVVPHMRIPDGTPPGAIVEFEATIDSGERKTNEHASGVGAGLTTNSDEAAGKFATTAPGANLPGITSTGGDSTSEFSFSVSNKKTLVWLFGGAAVLRLLGAAYCTWRAIQSPLTVKTWFRGAVVCSGAAGALVACAAFPGFGALILIGVFALGVGFYVYENRVAAKGMAAEQTLVGVLKGVETLSAPQRIPAKEAVKTSTDEAHKAIITTLKTKVGLPSERSTP